MAIPIPSPLVEFILLGPLDDRRQLQDSPILGDVWVEFGKRPSDALDVLIEPYKGQHAGFVAFEIDDRLGEDDDANIAYLQGLVVARLTFRELLHVVVPMTKWWQAKRARNTPPKADPAPKSKKKGRQKAAALPPAASLPWLSEYTPETLKTVLANIIEMAKDWQQSKMDARRPKPPSLDRFVALTGLILWAGSVTDEAGRAATTDEQIALVLEKVDVGKMVELLGVVAAEMLAEPSREDGPLIWQVSLNRRAVPAITRSVPAVKADAATTLFKVNCSEIVWAVIDSGIDGAHPAFRKEDGSSRVVRSFDFYNFRRIVSLNNARPTLRARNVELLMQNRDRMKNPPDTPDEDLQRLADDAKRQGPIHWNLVERFVEIKPETEPPAVHGTHVAGILGASKAAAQRAAGADVVNEDFADGMCPDISLYDFRVLGQDMPETEFAVIAALQFIRHLNERHNYTTIHGANLSLSIPHHVRNYACGRTPVCDECERLVESGVVVVAAAGNHGYKSFETREGSYDSYAAFSITDPGNADGVVTVGSTHRFSPHTYGVSFFSSRGPTGDGRLKPDLVAPGERIRAPFPGSLWDDLDGTSMAAPHVSGAAAMLMARYSELIGQPRRIKRILCDSATDLGRERSFQGHGMLDVLRAFQSI